MAAITWDTAGQHFFETGVDHCVLYVMGSTGYGTGVAWNGITTISEKPSGADASPLYADNMKYLNLIANEDFGATIEAYTYPDAFAACDGTETLGTVTGITIGQQARKTFGLVYRTRIGNDVDGDSKGYKLHIIYGCTAAPSERAYNTVNDSPEAATFSWEITTVPVNVTGKRPTAIVTVDSTKIDAAKLTLLENKLFGTDGVSPQSGTEPTLILPDEIITLLA